jgi:predicted nucleotidyltransferase component of viral defense system
MKELENLLPKTAEVLTKLAKFELLQKFTFVGGSALALSLAHRLSEDLDLFTWEAELELDAIFEVLNDEKFANYQLTSSSKRQVDCMLEGVKVTFFANNWAELSARSHLFDNLYVADLQTLVVMKVNTLFLRAKFRDYYDLYVLNKQQFSLQEMYALSTKKIKNLHLSLFQRALLFTDDIADENIAHLSPKYPVNLKQIAKHFENEIKKQNKK